MLAGNIGGTTAALASDQRPAALLLVKSRALVPAQNAQGSTYYFDLGAGASGTGVGCSQVAGTQGRSLVGLKLIRDSKGNHSRWSGPGSSSTVPKRVTAPTTPVSATRPARRPAAASATQISCGDLTMAANGVHSCWFKYELF